MTDHPTTGFWQDKSAADQAAEQGVRYIESVEAFVAGDEFADGEIDGLISAIAR